MDYLVDSFGRKNTYLRISVTDRCNLRCSYCMPSERIELQSRSDILSFDEIERVAKIFAEMGINKIRLTGGEPLVRKDLPKLVERLAKIHGVDFIGMTTNGVLLGRFARELKSAGLSALNVSLDTLKEDRFERITLRPLFKEVMNGINTAMIVGFIPLKLNVVVIGGINDDEMLDFVEFVRYKPINVRFIEYMPFKNNQWNQNNFIPFVIMKQQVQERYNLIPIMDELQPPAVAKDFIVENFVGKISFIASMSDHFCAGCNRLRLMADGSIKSCLFFPADLNIKNALRGGASNEILANMIRFAARLKPQVHPKLEELIENENQSMIEIGG